MKRYFKRLPIEILNSALSYQRNLNENFITMKVKEFDSNKVNTPKISLRTKNGKEEYRIIDGQHTISIVSKIGWKNIQCEVREGLTDEDENKWFYEINNKGNSRQQTASTLLNARINGKFDNNLNSLVNSLDSVGYKLKTVDVKHTNGVIRAGVTIETIFNDMGEEEFKKFMELHNSAWNGDKKAMTSPFLKGFKKFYDTYKEEIDLKRFNTVFVKKSISAEQIIKEATLRSDIKDTSIKYAWILVINYNKGLSNGNKLMLTKLEM